MNTKSETSCAANDITKRQVEERVIGKDVRQMCDKSPFCRKSTPSVISRAFAVVFSRMRFRIRCPVLQVSLPEVYDKMAEINGFTQRNSPTCDLCDADDVQDEQHVLFHCAERSPRDYSPQEICTSVSPNRNPRCVTFLIQNNNKLYFFLHELIAFSEQASSHTS